MKYEDNGSFVTVPQGSITVNGISLTVAKSEDTQFSVAIIPYTWEFTNMKYLKIGDKVNLEFDIIGKYIARLIKNRMSINKYKGYSLRNRVFFGFLLVCFLSVVASSLVPYFVLRKSMQQSKIDMQNKTNAVMRYLDYELSQTCKNKDLPKVLGIKF
jgi:hypothetical protein